MKETRNNRVQTVWFHLDEIQKPTQPNRVTQIRIGKFMPEKWFERTFQSEEIGLYLELGSSYSAYIGNKIIVIQLRSFHFTQ